MTHCLTSDCVSLLVSPACDDECSGLLISDMDRLLSIINEVTLTTPLPPPYKVLYRFENMTEELKVRKKMCESSWNLLLFNPCHNYKWFHYFDLLWPPICGVPQFDAFKFPPFEFWKNWDSCVRTWNFLQWGRSLHQPPCQQYQIFYWEPLHRFLFCFVLWGSKIQILFLSSKEHFNRCLVLHPVIWDF